MKRTGQRRKKRQSKSLNPELQGHKIKFLEKRIIDQQSKIEEQWQEINKLQSSDTDS